MTIRKNGKPEPRPRCGLLVAGSSNTDLVILCRDLPQPGETVCGGEFRRFAGGKGANQAVAAARGGASVIFVGARGDDEFGATAAAGLTAEGVDITNFIIKPGASSGVALILVGGRTRENLIAVAKSANHRLQPADIRRAAPAFNHCRAAVAQLEIPVATVLAVAEQAATAGIPFILNPSPVPAKLLPVKLLRLVHTLVPNAREAEVMTGCTRPQQAAAALLHRGCRQVVITLGAKGAFWRTREAEGFVPAVKVKPVDTVGAGDCFIAWLALGVTEGLELPAAVARAVRAAAIAVTRSGAQAGMPWRREVV